MILQLISAQSLTPTDVINLVEPGQAMGSSGICPQGTYGEKCEYECHCLKGTECDPQTGQCPDGCAAGWSGPPYCQAGIFNCHVGLFKLLPGKYFNDHGVKVF